MRNGSAQYYEDMAWDFLVKGNRNMAIDTMRHGAKISLGRGRSNRMKNYADAIESTELKTKEDIEKWLNNEIDPEGMGGDF